MMVTEFNNSRTVAKCDLPFGYSMFYIWCEGCKHAHGYRVGTSPSPTWTFDGNLDAPTFKPSYKEFCTGLETKKETTLCHFFVTAGVIDYLGDSSNHQLRGKHPLVRIPVGYGIGDTQTPE